MVDILPEVEYGRILGSFTAVSEDAGGTPAPEATQLSGRIRFTPTRDSVSYINSLGETSVLYVSPVDAIIHEGRIVGADGKDGVTLLASDSQNVSASVLWDAKINLEPINSGDEAPEDHTFRIEVRRGEISSLIDVIKANSRVHNIALFNDVIAEAAEKFWERVESGEFRGNQGPPGPAGGPGVGVPGPSGVPGKNGTDGDVGTGGNLIPDGDLESPGFLVTGDFVDNSDSASGSKSVRLTYATSRKIATKPDRSYVGGVYVKADQEVTFTVSLRVFGNEGDIDRVITSTHTTTVDEWREYSFSIDGKVGDQSVEIVFETDGRVVTADYFTFIDSTVIKGLQTKLDETRANLEQAMLDLDANLELADSEREKLNDSLNDLAVVLENTDVDLGEVNSQLDDLRDTIATEKTEREEANQAAQDAIQALDDKLADIGSSEELEAIRNELSEVISTATAAQATADAAVTSANAASQAALEAAGIAASKGRVIVQETEPQGEDRRASNIWIQPVEDDPTTEVEEKAVTYVYLEASDEWVPTTSSELAQAAQNALDAREAAQQAQQRAETAIANAETAKAAAEAAQATADQATLDAADAHNTAVTLSNQAEQAAKDFAELAASGAEQSAIDAAEQRAIELADAAEQAAKDAAAAALATTKSELETAIVNSSNGKNSITVSPSEPSGSGIAVGDVWWRIDGDGTVYGQWAWDGDSWVPRTISSEVIANLDVNKLVVAGSATINEAVINKIWADGISAKTITANKLVIASENLVPDPQGIDPEVRSLIGGSRWAWNNTDKYWTTEATSDGTTVSFNAFIVPDGGTNYDPVAVQPGLVYSISYEVWVDSASDVTGSRAAIYLKNKDETTSYTGDGFGGTDEDVDNTTILTPGIWNKISRSWEAPESALTAGFQLQVISPPESLTEVRLRNPRIVPKAGAVTIQNGAISSNHITSDSIDTQHLRAEAITADKIGANAIVAGKIDALAVNTRELAAEAVKADKIAANAIIAGKVDADAIGAREIIANSITSEEILAGSITAEELAVGAVTAEKIAVGAIDAEKIHGGSFTGETFFGGVFEGGLIRTTPSGAGQVVLSDTAFTSSYNGNTDTAPGLAIIPSDTSDVSINPGIGPFEGGVSVDGGQNKSGGSAFMRTKPTGSLMYTFDPSLGRSMIETKPGEVLLTALNTISSGGGGGKATLTHDYSQLATTGTNGEYGDLHTTSTTARMRVVSPDGSVSWTEATSNLVHLTLLDTSGHALSTIRTDGRSAWMRANAGRNMEYSAIKADPTLVALTAYNSSAAVQSTARVNSNAAWLRTYGSTSDEYGLIQSGPDSAYIKANNGAGERRIEVTSTVARMFSKSATTGDGSRVEVDQGYVRIRRDVGGDARDDCGFDLSGQNAEMWGSDDNYKRGQIAAGKTGVVLNSGYGQQIYLRDGVITVSGQIDSTHKIKAQQLQMQNPPTTNISANVAMSSPSHSSAEERGRLYYITSSRRYKKNIIDWAPDVKSVLQMRPRLWQAKADDAPEGDDWVAGFIAEEIDDLGLTPLVRYGPDPEGGLRPEGLNYDRIGAAQQIVITKQEKEIQILIEENREIKSRLDRIEALLEKESV